MLENNLFLGALDFEKCCLSLGKQWFFENSMFRKMVAKSMQNGKPKVIKIHEKIVLGRPSVAPGSIDLAMLVDFC